MTKASCTPVKIEVFQSGNKEEKIHDFKGFQIYSSKPKFFLLVSLLRIFIWARAEGHFMPVECKVVSLARCLLRPSQDLRVLSSKNPTPWAPEATVS